MTVQEFKSQLIIRCREIISQEVCRRIKLCGFCNEFFGDKTRNATKQHCGKKECSNKLNSKRMRIFREKNK